MSIDRSRIDRVLVVSRGDENGFAMIVSMIVSTVAILLVTAILAQGTHLLQATTYDRKWNNSLQVAEAGVERAVVELMRNPGCGSTTPVPAPCIAASAPFGEFETTVSTPAAGYRLITSTGYSPSSTAVNRVKRRIVVRYGPAPTFKYALFSDSTLNIKNINNNCIVGDSFANETITVNNNACVAGSVISATGAVDIENGGEVRKKPDGTGGDVYSGGLGPSGADWGIRLSSNSVKVFGSAHAQQDTCPSAAPSKYKIVGDGRIFGDAFAGGAIAPTVVSPGVAYPSTCQLSRPTESLPTFQVGQIQTLYGVAVTEYTSVAAFNTYVAANAANLSGYFYVNEPAATTPIELGSTTVTDTFVLITNALIDMSTNFEVSVADPVNDFVNIISLNSSISPPAIWIKNNFTVNDSSPVEPKKPPVLLYSEGLIEVKNSPLSNGSVYAQRVVVKNNLDITYDPRVERILGFGPSRFDRVSWNEVPAN